MCKRTKDNKNWRAVIIEDVYNEGLFYAILHYDDYKWVNDEHFQKLRQKLLESIEEFCAYVGIPQEQ